MDGCRRYLLNNIKKIKVSITNPNVSELVDEFIKVSDLKGCEKVKHGEDDCYLVPNALDSFDLIYVKDNKCYWRGIVPKF